MTPLVVEWKDHAGRPWQAVLVSVDRDVAVVAIGDRFETIHIRSLRIVGRSTDWPVTA